MNRWRGSILADGWGEEFLFDSVPKVAACRPLLDISDVHVWLIDLDRQAEIGGPHWDALDPEEQLLATRLVRSGLSRRYVAAHGSLRSILASYLDLRPCEVRIRRIAGGKPVLDSCHGAGLAFNLSHAGTLAIAAITSGADVGADVERLRPIRHMQSIAEHFFSHDEQDRLAAVPPQWSRFSFFLCWTRKEAFIKATGEGMARSPGSFSVSIDPVDEPRLVAVNGESADNWSMASFIPRPGYVGACVVRLSTPTWRRLPMWAA
jgi:4'-phosphopantetheinyl transferase